MPNYTATVQSDRQAYDTIEVEAETVNEALEKITERIEEDSTSFETYWDGTVETVNKLTEAGRDENLLPAPVVVCGQPDELHAAAIYALREIHKLWCCPTPKRIADWAARCDVMADYARAAIAKVEGRQ